MGGAEHVLDAWPAVRVDGCGRAAPIVVSSTRNRCSRAGADGPRGRQAELADARTAEAIDGTGAKTGVSCPFPTSRSSVPPAVHALLTGWRSLLKGAPNAVQETAEHGS